MILLDRRETCTGREPSRQQGVTRGRGGTYDPETVEGHMGMEVLQVLQPPLVRVRVGEVCEGSEAGPDLRGDHKTTGSVGRQLMVGSCGEQGARGP